jgi:hypothetical protein
MTKRTLPGRKIIAVPIATLSLQQLLGTNLAKPQGLPLTLTLLTNVFLAKKYTNNIMVLRHHLLDTNVGHNNNTNNIMVLRHHLLDTNVGHYHNNNNDNYMVLRHHLLDTNVVHHPLHWQKKWDNSYNHYFRARIHIHQNIAVEGLQMPMVMLLKMVATT